MAPCMYILYGAVEGLSDLEEPSPSPRYRRDSCHDGVIPSLYGMLLLPLIIT